MAQAYNDTAFRALFKEFSNVDDWPEMTLQMFWTLATDYISTNDCPCNNLNGNSLTLALNLMTAHLISTFTQTSSTATDGSVPGQAPTAIELSATVGAISVSNMPPPVADMWEYWLGTTAYGQNLLALLKLKAVGGFYVGGLPERTGFRKVGGVFF